MSEDPVSKESGIEDSSKQPSAEEIFIGKDVVLGKEIVELLAAEEIGVPIYELNPERKSQTLVNKQVGEEDFSVTQRDVTKHGLLGIVFPTEKSNEYVFLGTEEVGGVFTINEDSVIKGKFNRESNPAIYFGGKFWEKMNEVYSSYCETILREDTHKKEFNQVATASVLRAREEKIRLKQELAESRRNLRQALFGVEEKPSGQK